MERQVLSTLMSTPQPISHTTQWKFFDYARQKYVANYSFVSGNAEPMNAPNINSMIDLLVWDEVYKIRHYKVMGIYHQLTFGPTGTLHVLIFKVFESENMNLEEWLNL